MVKKVKQNRKVFYLCVNGSWNIIIIFNKACYNFHITFLLNFLLVILNVMPSFEL